jgi:tetratricopeptide (TPR) repeat protein
MCDIFLRSLFAPILLSLCPTLSTFVAVVAPGVSLQAAQNDATHNEHYQRGVENYHSGRYTEAIEELEQAVRLDPRNEWTTYYLIRAYLANKDRLSAENLASGLIRQNPTFARGFFLLGYIYFDTHQWTLAAENLQTAVRMEPNFWESRMFLGSTYVLLGRLTEAEEELRVAVNLNPQSPETHYYIGRLHFTKNMFPEALQEFSRMLELDPLSVKAYNNLGLTRLALDQAEAAKTNFQEAIRLGEKSGTPSEWPYINLGKMEYEKGKAETACRLFSQAVEINPQNDVSHFWLGKCLLRMGQTEQARDCLEKAVGIYPKSSEYYYLLANIYRKLGRETAAQVALERYLKLRNNKKQ